MADVKITALTAISANPVNPATFPMPMVDLLDNSQAASGSTRKVTVNQILGAGGTATLASATITGAATVGTTLGVTGVSTLASAVVTGDLTARTTGLTVNSSGVGVGVTASLGAGNIQIGAGKYLGYSATAYITPEDNVQGARIKANNILVDATSESKFNIGGTLAMTLNSTVLAMGVTPAPWATIKAIQVGAGASLFGYTATEAVISGNTYYNGGLKYVGNGEASQYQQQVGEHRWFSAVNNAAGAGAAITFGDAKMTLDASGNLLVGRTTLFAQPSRFTVESNSQTTSICGIFNDARTDSTSAINIAFYRNGIKVGSVDCTNAATSYVTSSDYRLKEDVQPLSGGLARVSALKPSIYKWKINGSNGEGFIAHELAEVVPAAVTGEKDAVNKDGTVNPQGVDLSKVVPILVAAIQELTTRVQTLEAR